MSNSVQLCRYATRPDLSIAPQNKKFKLEGTEFSALGEKLIYNITYKDYANASGNTLVHLSKNTSSRIQAKNR